MATQVQMQAMEHVFEAAKASGVLFPDAQSCEVMVETEWLSSELGVEDNNLFGMKQHVHPIYGTVNLPTREYLCGKWVVVDAAWVKYPSMEACFQDRMNTLRTLAPHYPHYAAALAAKTQEEFLTQVSLTWSTGPQRGEECVEIYHAHKSVFAQ